MKATTAEQRRAPTVLVMARAADAVSVLATVARQRGLDVLVLQDAEHLLQQVRSAAPELILVEASPPASEGIEACRRLKEDQVLRDIPVIVMAPDRNGRLRGRDAGAADTLAMPLLPEEASACIDAQLSLQRLRRRLNEQGRLLQKEIELRQWLEAQLQHVSALLVQRDSLETEELAHVNATLDAEMKERGRVERSLRETETRMRRLVDSNIIGIFFWNARRVVTDANDAFLHLIGYTREELEAGEIQWAKLSPPEYTTKSEQALEELRSKGMATPYEKEYIRKDGSRIPILVGGAVLDDKNEEGVAFVLDLTERKKAEERVRYMADHDALTGLPNRALLQDRLQQALARAHRADKQVALLFIDLDYFKHINDSLGHQVGDRLLRDVARRLSGCIREDDTLARLGGDEFVMILPLEGDSTDAAIVAGKALQALETPFYCDNHELHVAGSIGISLYPQDGKDVDTLMRMADTAMYYAKEKGRGNFQFFTPELNRAAQRRHAATIALRHALSRGELELHYQPQVDIESGRIFAAEALLRWRRDGRPVACHDFVTIAEETGLILPIGEWVLRQACRQLAHWHGQGFGNLVVAVNLSPRQFFQPNFFCLIEDILKETGIPADCLDLEITEGTLMQRTEENVAALCRLSDMGIKLSIDDFGTGYSSLAYLQRFPVDALKIDRSFVNGIGRSANDTALVTAIISMAHSLRLKVLAEGVETEEQIGFLQAHGCLSAQGFFYSEALPAEALTVLLQKQHRWTAHERHGGRRKTMRES